MTNAKQTESTNLKIRKKFEPRNAKGLGGTQALDLFCPVRTPASVLLLNTDYFNLSFTCFNFVCIIIFPCGVVMSIV